MLCSVPLSLTCVINYSCQTVRLSVDEAFRRPVSGSAVHTITKRQLEADNVRERVLIRIDRCVSGEGQLKVTV